MAEIQAIPISKLEGVTTSDDGEFALIKTIDFDGAEIVLAIPTNQLSALVELAAAGRIQARKQQNASPNMREIHNTSWWELSRDLNSGMLILSLTLAGGGKIDLGLPDPMPAAILETLQVMLGQSTPLSPGSPSGKVQ